MAVWPNAALVRLFILAVPIWLGRGATAQTSSCDPITCSNCDVSAASCGNFNTPLQNRNALLDFWTTLNGPNWRPPLRREGELPWNSSATLCRDLSGHVWTGVLTYCCWQGVTCCPSYMQHGLLPQWLPNCTTGSVWSLMLDRVRGNSHSGSNTSSVTCNGETSGPFTGLTGPIPIGPLCSLRCTLQVLSMNYNNLTGAVPTGLSSLQQLRNLYLSYNWLTGTIPPFFDQSQLQGLSQLVQLDMQQNCLTGTVPLDLCRGNRSSPLSDASLAFNALSGELRLTNCDHLILLDVENNQLTGDIVLDGAKLLHIFRIQNNNLSGTIADGFGELVTLATFSANNNSLRGSLNDNIDFMQFLSTIALADNKLTGTIPDTISELGSLGVLSLSHNLLTGSMPSGFTSLGNLNSMNLSINYLNGTIPDGEWQSTALTGLDVSMNNLEGPIPASLSRLVNLFSLRLNDNDLTSSIPTGLGSVTSLTALILYNNFLTGTIPASFQNASELKLLTSGNFLSCCGENFNFTSNQYASINYSAPRLPPWIITQELQPSDDMRLWCPALAVWRNGAVEVLDWDIEPSYYLYEGCDCISNYHLVNMTAVESNIQKPVYGGLGWQLACVPNPSFWEENSKWLIPLICVCSALVMLVLLYIFGHRSMLVRSYVNARKRLKGAPQSGLITVVVTDIEGYSDLMKQSPELMTRALNTHNAVIRNAKWKNFGYTVEQEGDSYAIAFYEALDAASFCLMAQQALMREKWPEGLFLDTRTHHKRSSGVLNSVNNLAAALGSRFLRSRPTVESTAPSELVASSDSDRSEAGLNGVTSATDSSVGLRKPSRSMSAKGSGPPGEVLWAGVRVRMGMATGTLVSGTTIRSSCVMEDAKLVSDAGKGGQLLMDERTFLEIKDRLEELGAVDHNGINSAKLSAKRPWWSLWIAIKSRCPDQAVILDMGEYRNFSTGELPLLLLDIGVGGCNDFMAAMTPGERGDLDRTTLRGGAGGSGGGGAGDGARKGGIGRGSVFGAARRHLSLRQALSPKTAAPSKRLRLIQILSQNLAGRAKVFGNDLALKPEWLMVDMPYFAAPGTHQAPMSRFELAVDPPNVTMVFAIVDGGKQYALLNRRDSRQVHLLCAAHIHSTLRCVAGGYLCRVQDGDLKYLICFATPEAALQWGLLFQKVLLFADWPESALRFDKWRTERDADGRLLFRGPRVKMGLCEGAPKTIIPDHLGRADYHGASINQAARFMDAGAHGGQIVCEETLALKVLGTWRRDLVNPTQTVPDRSAHGASSVSSHSTPMGPRSQSLSLVRTVSPDAPCPTPSAADGSSNGSSGGGKGILSEAAIKAQRTSSMYYLEQVVEERSDADDDDDSSKTPGGGSGGTVPPAARLGATSDSAGSDRRPAADSLNTLADNNAASAADGGGGGGGDAAGGGDNPVRVSPSCSPLGDAWVARTHRLSDPAGLTDRLPAAAAPGAHHTSTPTMASVDPASSPPTATHPSTTGHQRANGDSTHDRHVSGSAPTSCGPSGLTGSGTTSDVGRGLAGKTASAAAGANAGTNAGTTAGTNAGTPAGAAAEGATFARTNPLSHPPGTSSSHPPPPPALPRPGPHSIYFNAMPLPTAMARPHSIYLNGITPDSDFGRHFDAYTDRHTPPPSGPPTSTTGDQLSSTALDAATTTANDGGSADSLAVGLSPSPSGRMSPGMLPSNRAAFDGVSSTRQPSTASSQGPRLAVEILERSSVHDAAAFGTTPGNSGDTFANGSVISVASSFAPFVSRPSVLGASSRGTAGGPDSAATSPAGPGGGGTGGVLPMTVRTAVPSRFAPPQLHVEPPGDGVSTSRRHASCQLRPVLACRTGVFRFKGSSEDIHMVHVVLTELAARRFPLEPPKGKGNRIRELSGTLADGMMPMPNIETAFAERFELFHSQDSGVFPSAEDSPASNPAKARKAASLKQSPPTATQWTRVSRSFSAAITRPVKALQFGGGDDVRQPHLQLQLGHAPRHHEGTAAALMGTTNGSIYGNAADEV